MTNDEPPILNEELGNALRAGGAVRRFAAVIERDQVNAERWRVRIFDAEYRIRFEATDIASASNAGNLAAETIQDLERGFAP